MKKIAVIQRETVTIELPSGGEVEIFAVDSLPGEVHSTLQKKTDEEGFGFDDLMFVFDNSLVDKENPLKQEFMEYISSPVVLKAIADEYFDTNSLPEEIKEEAELGE